MSEAHLEVERTYDVPRELGVPDLRELGPVEPVRTYELEATYYDTPDLRLRRARATLRHRTGGVDAGWHLKTPQGHGRLERQVQGPPGEVPAGLAALVRSRVRTAELAPVARIITVRRVHTLPGVELADDDVLAVPLAGGPPLRWREWEVELTGGRRKDLERVERLLLRAGAVAAAQPSKVGRVLPLPPQPVPGRASSAGAVLVAHLRDQVEQVLAGEPEVHLGAPDAVHRMRVATRRLRSALTTFGPLLDRTQTDPLRDRLRDLAAVLGRVRDLEVLRVRVLGGLQDEGAPVDTVAQRFDALQSGARARLLAVLDSDVHLALLEDLAALSDNPPLTKQARRSATAVLPRLVRRDWRRLDRAEQLHEVRKGVKRVRYAAQALEPVLGVEARRTARHLRRVQDELGAVQDGAAAMELLHELADGSDAFTLGRLHGLEQARAEVAAAQLPALRADLLRARWRRWAR